jgi:UDP-GlcNAc:undecaprenyl-phosphate/decaprenyl-phosphate GlcNAc-1-phosphate transferase
MMIKELLIFLTTLILAVALFPRLAGIAARIGLVDLSSGRKAHGRPKPLVGGIGMAMALAVSCLAFVPLSNLRGFYAGFVLLVIVGFLDDFKEMRYAGKFIAQILAVLFMVYFSGLSLNTFGDLLGLGPVNFGILALPITIFCTVGVINAFNMVDGLDGLAGGISFIAFLSFSLLADMNGQPELALLAIAFCGAVLAFLYYNRAPARLFMGDAGSLSIGFALTFFSIAVTQKQGGSISPVTALLILAVPVCDTIRVIIARLLRGKSPFKADNKHMHHLLIRIGFNRKRAVIIILLLSAFLAITAVAGSFLRLPDYYLFAAFALYGIPYTALAFSIRKILTAKLRLRRSDRGDLGDAGKFASMVRVLATAARIIRRERRIPLRAAVRGRFMGRAISGTMLDLGMKGFCAFIEHELSVGDRVEFEIFLTGLPAKLDIIAEVVWIGKARTAGRYGFRIARISEPEAEFLKIYLDNPDIRAA